jgi:hypothetical protein
VLVVVGLVTLAYAGSTSSEAFGTFNAAWDGASGVRAAADDTGGSVEVITRTTSYTETGAGTTAIVLAPEERYSQADVERIRGFVDRGGTVVVAEDFGGGGNRLLTRLGAEVRFDGRLVADQRHHGPTTEMPRATNVSETPYTTGVDGVMLNRGTVLTNTTNATVLVRTSEFAFLDADGDGEVDDEPLRSYPVAATEPVGTGTVVAVSDPSVFINAMQERASNAAFLQALIGDADRVLLDYSHAGAQPPVRAALLWLQRTPVALALVGLLGVALVARVARHGASLPFVEPSDGDESRTPVDEQSLHAYLRLEHPDVDPERARKLIGDVITDEKNTRRDE